MRIDKAFILFFSHYRRAITILKLIRSYLTSQTISKFLNYALKINDLVHQFFLKRSNRFLNHYQIYSFRRLFRAAIFKLTFSIRF